VRDRERIPAGETGIARYWPATAGHGSEHRS
jgi:hypothetical protein